MYRVLLTIKMLAEHGKSVPPSYLCCNRHNRACPQSCSQKSHLLAETHGRPQTRTHAHTSFQWWAPPYFLCGHSPSLNRIAPCGRPWGACRHPWVLVGIR